MPVTGTTAPSPVRPGPEVLDPRSAPPRSPVRTAVVGIVLMGLVLLGVGVVATVLGERADDAGGSSDWAGTVLDEPVEKPPIVLTDTAGQPFDLRAETDGRVALLFFGYVNCPDICPTHLANVARAFDELPREVSGNVDMVFVTVDPERDRPEVIRDFLDRFDRRFVGLYGTPDEIVEAQQQAGLAVAAPDRLEGDREYRVSHAGQVLAFGPDGVARLAYPFGTRQSDWVRDLPRLVEGVTP